MNYLEELSSELTSSILSSTELDFVAEIPVNSEDRIYVGGLENLPVNDKLKILSDDHNAECLFIQSNINNDPVTKMELWLTRQTALTYSATTKVTGIRKNSYSSIKTKQSLAAAVMIEDYQDDFQLSHIGYNATDINDQSTWVPHSHKYHGVNLKPAIYFRSTDKFAHNPLSTTLWFTKEKEPETVHVVNSTSAGIHVYMNNGVISNVVNEKKSVIAHMIKLRSPHPLIAKVNLSIYEHWENGKWVSSEVDNVRIELDEDKVKTHSQKYINDWIAEHTTSGLGIFEGRMFKSKADDFHFMMEFAQKNN